MSLGKKLLCSVGVMLALLLVLGAAALLVTRDLNRDLERAVTVTGRQQYLAGVVSAGASEMASFERGAVLASVLGDKAKADEYQEMFRQTEAALQGAMTEMRRLADERETLLLLDALDQQAALVTQAHGEQRQAIASQQMDTALSVFAQKSRAAGRGSGRAPE
jgi:CHASE3 domain sensor protein